MTALARSTIFLRVFLDANRPSPDEAGYGRRRPVPTSLEKRFMIRTNANQRLRMLFSSLRTLVKVAVASLIVGTILSHFGITADALLREAGVTPERVTEYGRRAWDWAAPNLMLGALVIVPLWFLIFLFRPPGAKSE
jgi:hypothetical protein